MLIFINKIYQIQFRYDFNLFWHKRQSLNISLIQRDVAHIKNDYHHFDFINASNIVW